MATEKAGPSARSATVVSQVQDDDVSAVIAERATALDARLLVAERDFGVERRRQAVGGQLLDLRTPGGTITDVLVPLHGRHQADNAAGALVAVEAFLGAHEGAWGPGTDAPASGAPPRPRRRPGRFAAVTSRGAGGRPASRWCCSTAPTTRPGAGLCPPPCWRSSWSTGAPWWSPAWPTRTSRILRELAPATGRLIVTANRNPRAAPAERLRKEAEVLGVHAEVAPGTATVRRAVDGAAESEAVVVTGSLYTVGEARDLGLGRRPGLRIPRDLCRYWRMSVADERTLVLCSTPSPAAWSVR